ncbi:MAG: hypothetical protein IIB67_11630 [Proteobacteria bacterium]|nr:hypothetical protein [Pseudomonadota bacterium]
MAPLYTLGLVMPQNIDFDGVALSCQNGFLEASSLVDEIGKHDHGDTTD